MTRFEEIRFDIQSALHEGYNIDELVPEDKASLDGFIWAIEQAETAFDVYDEPDEAGATIARIVSEIAESIREHVYNSLIGYACEMVYSFLDGYEEEKE